MQEVDTFGRLFRLRPPSPPPSSGHPLGLDVDDADVLGPGLLLVGVAFQLPANETEKTFRRREICRRRQRLEAAENLKGKY